MRGRLEENMDSEDFKERVRIIADFAIHEKEEIMRQKSRCLSSWFFQIEEMLGFPIKEITHIFDLFCKAKIFDYEVFTTSQTNKDARLAEQIKMVERKSEMVIYSSFEMGALYKKYVRKTGMHRDGHSEYGIKNISMKRLEGYFIAQDKKDADIVQHDVDILKQLIDSPTKLNAFIKQTNPVRGLPKISKQLLVWGDIKIPVSRGYGVIMDNLLENPKIISKHNTTIKKGIATHRKVLEENGGYKNEDTFRSAIKKLRANFKENKLPMDIVNCQKNNYILEIKTPTL